MTRTTFLRGLTRLTRPQISCNIRKSIRQSSTPTKSFFTPESTWRRYVSFAGAAAALVTFGVISADKVHNHSKPMFGKERRMITAEELGEHKSIESLWVAINGEVYDVTDFLSRHPGGADILIANAGTDASALFNGIHPPKTIESWLDPQQHVGSLDAASSTSSILTEEQIRIQKARSSLIGVNSLVRVSDFERLAQSILPGAAWAYYSTGSDGENSMRENNDAYSRVYFRPRVMRNVSKVDISTSMLGVNVGMPVYVSATARNGMGNPLGEVAVTKGVAEANLLQLVSNVASKGFDEVCDARVEGQPVAWQLYLMYDRERSKQQILDAIKLGANSIWLTVDTPKLGKRAREQVYHAAIKPSPPGSPLDPIKPTFAPHCPPVWDDIDWIRSIAPGIPIVLKGIQTWEDAVLAQQHGVQGIVLSNHGGRQLDFSPAPLKVLHEVNQNAPQLLRRKDFQIFVDGGIRSGTDVLKALCLGATAVGLGRPFIYAAAGWGPDGVTQLTRILRDEIEIGMSLLGVTSIDQLGPEYLDCSKL